MNGLDLFSGIGGLSLALRGYVQTAAYCEIDHYCQAVLVRRMRAGDLEPAPIWDDVRTLRGAALPAVDIIYGGFPCQDISVAGRGKGLAGERSGLVSEIFRLIEECKPAFVFLENVPAIRTRGGERVVKELACRGYDARWDCLSAADVGAPHKRQRWFLLAAYTGGLKLRLEQGRGGWESRQGTAEPGVNGTSEPVACSLGSGTGWADKWAVEPDVGRVAHGVPHRVDRIRALGNAVVPLQARTAFERLLGV